jgi:hypothetical protein
MTAWNLGAPLSALLLSAFYSVAVGVPPVPPIEPPHGLPTKGKAVNPSGQTNSTGNGIEYHGGPVLNNRNGPTLYFIWYGDWSGNSATQILPDFAYHIGGSPYFNINTTYYDYDKESEKEFVLNRVSFKGSIDDPYSLGGSLSDNDVQTVVANAIESRRLPVDPNGVYLVLTSADVMQQEFCVNFCAWHWSTTNGGFPLIAGVDIKFGHVGNSDQCPAACQWQNPSPNNSPAAYDMASAIAHELEESVTDPDDNAWINSDRSENADLGAWTFGREMILPDGATYNMKLGRRLYHIQRNWVNARGGYCALSWDE